MDSWKSERERENNNKKKKTLALRRQVEGRKSPVDGGYSFSTQLSLFLGHPATETGSRCRGDKFAGIVLSKGCQPGSPACFASPDDPVLSIVRAAARLKLEDFSYFLHEQIVHSARSGSVPSLHLGGRRTRKDTQSPGSSDRGEQVKFWPSGCREEGYSGCWRFLSPSLSPPTKPYSLLLSLLRSHVAVWLTLPNVIRVFICRKRKLRVERGGEG